MTTPFKPAKSGLVVPESVNDQDPQNPGPSFFKVTTNDGEELLVSGFLAVTQTFIAMMNEADEISLVVPMIAFRKLVKIDVGAVGSA